MGIRDTINRNPRLAAGVIVLCILVPIFTILLRRPTRAIDYEPTKSLFSDDDGKTWFADDLTHVPPWDHDGKLAYRARVFRCGGEPPFVGFLERYPQAVKLSIDQALATADPRARFSLALQAEGSCANEVEVKLPGAASWVQFRSSTMDVYRKITSPICPVGNTPQEIVP